MGSCLAFQNRLLGSDVLAVVVAYRSPLALPRFRSNLLSVVGRLLIFPDQDFFDTSQRLHIGDQRAGRVFLVPIPRIQRRLGGCTDELIRKRDRTVDDNHPIFPKDAEELLEDPLPIQRFIPRLSGRAKGRIDVDQAHRLRRQAGQMVSDISLEEHTHLLFEEKISGAIAPSVFS